MRNWQAQPRGGARVGKRANLWHVVYYSLSVGDEEFGEPGFGDDDEDEEGGGWDVGDDDLELPADLVSLAITYTLLRPKKRVCF